MSKDAESPADRRRLQMADIARLAGVSVSTVSRALNGSTLINEATRVRIGELARSLNYTINESAKNLRLQRNQTIAVVVPYDAQSRQHISDPFFLSMVGSLADALTDRGYDMLLSRWMLKPWTRSRPCSTRAAPSASCSSASGATTTSSTPWRRARCRWSCGAGNCRSNCIARSVATTCWAAGWPRSTCWASGGVASSSWATCSYPRSPCVWRATSQALAEAGVAFDQACVRNVPFEEEHARQAIAEQVVAHAPPFDAIFASSDLIAILAMRALRESGRRVPQEVAVVGYDNITLAAYADPPLSTIHQPVAEAGAELVNALTQLIAGVPQAPRVLPVTLVVRQSA
ncbi:MAG: LacI family DNA-binding transcriptional regulator [Burkholderiaceae bacterium]